MIAIVHHPDYVVPAAAGSSHKWNKNGLVRDLLRESGAVIDWIEPEPMPRMWIEQVHDPGYVAEVLGASVPAAKERRIGFPVTEKVARRAQIVPGGTWRAALTALERGFAANIAGGSHHALADTGAGYCVFNDLAITANRLTSEGVVERVLIVDCDVHQGDGTAALMAGRGDVATYSIHADKNFPARKARSTLDVALPDATGDTAYLRALADSLPPLIERFAPDIILYQAGVDPFGGDRLGRLALTEDGLRQRDTYVAGLAIERAVPLASTLGGGYDRDALAVAGRHVASILTLGRAFEKGCISGTAAFSTLGCARRELR